ncbi:MAG: VWA domain-containing protein [Kosmotoga sp.]|uniref:vWA domain-containing protein n=1 Tax=Kosmotoga sp. TaxID=1955248 RepID=UPI001D1FE4D8|nr:vWA domain-containing protein [Kosmotoga sp.]MBO8167544.1 VWA domain-containing protein [Kosmotoga sp.]
MKRVLSLGFIVVITLFALVSCVTFNGRGPISVAIAMDHSGSMIGAPFSNAINASKFLVQNALTDFDEVAYVGFADYGDQVKFPSTGFTSKNQMLSFLNGSLTASGATALYDGLYYSAKRMDSANSSNRKYIVLLTDGWENASIHTKSEAISACTSRNITVFTIGYAPSQNDVEESFLKDVANATGGKYFYAPDNATLQAIFGEIIENISGDAYLK